MRDADPRLPLDDILGAIAAIESYMVGRDFDGYQANPMLRDAVERNIERISEASRRIPASLKETTPEIPWHHVAAVGNVLRHGYRNVDDHEIWRTVVADLPPLRRAVEAMMLILDPRKPRP